MANIGTLRRRTNAKTTPEDNSNDEAEPLLPSNAEDDKKKQKASFLPNVITSTKPTYWLTSLLILRSMACIYLIAFCVAYIQNHALIGTTGIYPYTNYLNRLQSNSEHLNSNWNKFVNVPTLLWFMPATNDSIDQIAICGIILSSLVVLFGHRFCHVFVFLALWILYHSLVNVGQLFYGYGWESLVVETGFLSIFICRIRLFSWKQTMISDANPNPFLLPDQKPPVPPSYIILYLFKWLIFRNILGAGLIKIRAGGCWLDYTCMDYHYETQPNPSPISWFMHNNPHWFHQFEVGVNHFVELIAPWLLLIPVRNVTLIAGLIQILFQFLIIISGNLAFLNWLTIIPCLAALDDRFCYNYLWFLFTKTERKYLYFECANYYIEYEKKQKNIAIETQRFSFVNVYSSRDFLYKIIAVLVAIFIGYLSIDVVNNLISPRQTMNRSFDKFRIVNTYGAFGHVGEERFEVIFSMTTDEYIDDETEWKEVLFKCKPGPIDRRPCLITPYHYRLDWQIWFAGFYPHTPNRHPWIFLFVAQLLSHHQDTIELLDESVDLYLKQNNITFIKADMWKYEFTENLSDSNWWKREIRTSYLPPLNLQNRQFQDVLRQLDWNGVVKKRKKKKKKSHKK